MLTRRGSRSLSAVFVAVMTLLAVGAAPASAAMTKPGDQYTSFDEVRADPGYRNKHRLPMRLYRAFFERDPDPSGAVYWIGVVDEGRADTSDLTWAFSHSQEFKNTYGDALTIEDFVRIVYGNVLGREPDKGGYDYWVAEMHRGLARHEMVRFVVENEEFIRKYPYEPLHPYDSLRLVGIMSDPCWGYSNNTMTLGDRHIVELALDSDYPINVPNEPWAINGGGELWSDYLGHSEFGKVVLLEAAASHSNPVWWSNPAFTITNTGGGSITIPAGTIVCDPRDWGQ